MVGSGGTCDEVSDLRCSLKRPDGGFWASAYWQASAVGFLPYSTYDQIL